MAAKKISFKVSSPIEVGNVDVEFEVRDGAALMGTVAISRGGIDWRGKGKRRATPVSWARFADLMSGADERVSVQPRPPRARRPVKQPTAVADQKTIRSWAQEKGMPFNARGRLPKSLTDAYYAAHA
jgi:Lsr2